MKTKVLRYCLVAFCCMAVACQSNDQNAPVYKVQQTDFEEVAYVEGYVELVDIIPITVNENVEGVLAYLIEDGTEVKAGDVIAIIDADAIETEYETILSEYEIQKSNLAELKVNQIMNQALMEAQVLNNEADTQIAQMDSLQIEYASPVQRKIKELELEQILITRKKLEKKLESFYTIQQSELHQAEIRLQQVEMQVKQIKDRMDATTIRAPQDGIVYLARDGWVNVRLGGEIWGGVMFAYMPASHQMKLKLTASETDSRIININDSVEIAFDAMPDNRAWGHITMKSPIGQTNVRTFSMGRATVTIYSGDQPSKIKLYEMEAVIDSALQMPSAGYSARCKVITKKVPDAIVVPQVAVFDEDSLKTVYVKTAKGFERRPIQTGVVSTKEAVVVSGLKAGEEISLIKINQ